MYDIDKLLDENGKEISVGDLRDLCEYIGMDQPDSKNMRKINNDSYSIEIDTPDGWVELTHFVYKGKLPMVRIETTLGYITTCATNHLIQTIDESWIPASNVQKGTHILVHNGTMDIVTTIQNLPEEECYDFTVNHSNHRYWGDGISSHNSGKSYIVSGNIIKDAQEKNIHVILIDTENALDESWLLSLGVNTSEEWLTKINLAMIDDVAKVISDFVSDYKSAVEGVPEEERQKYLFVIDSIGMLMTPTDVSHFEKGDLKGDMGRKPKALKALVTNCTNMFGDLEIGLVVTNHTYESQDMFNPDAKVSGGCLVADTKVLLEDGTYKNIQDFQIGDKVQTIFGPEEILSIWEYEKETYTLELEDGTVLECSPEHKFLVNRPEGQVWVEAEDLTVLDEIVSI